MRVIEMNEKSFRKPQRKAQPIRWKPILIFAIIISIVGVNIFLAISLNGDYTKAVKGIFDFNKNRITYNQYTFSFDESIPSSYAESVKESLQSIEYNGKKRFVYSENNANIAISKNKQENSVEIFNKDFIPVSHAYSLTTRISEEMLSDFNVYIIGELYKGYLEEQYNISVNTVSNVEDLAAKLKESDKNIGLIGFSDLNKNLKMLSVNNIYFLDDTSASIPIHFYASVNNVDEYILDILAKNIDIEQNEYDENKIFKVNMSGVVAIARNLARKMDSLKSYTYPADKLGSFLADADITHISNEVSFVPGCVGYTGMTFCSKPEYIESLKLSGVDIVELTGNHNNDYGSKYNTSTIETYKSLGWEYFGGGLDATDASKILYIEQKGTKIAFLGYNYYDTMQKTGAIATDTHSGANSYSREKMKSDIETAKSNGADFVIVDFQFQECYCYPDGDVVYPICYKPISSPDQEKEFKLAIDSGANMVVGTQAHQPQTYELYNDGVIYYGLGNLYFDQAIWIGTRQGLILTHYFSEGKLLQTKMTPIYMDSSYQPKLATQEQGDYLLQLLKNAR